MSIESNEAITLVLVLVLLWFEIGWVACLVLVLQHSVENCSTLSYCYNCSHMPVTFCIPLQCLKESYVKATGVGIGHDLQAVEFQINTTELSPQVCCMLDVLGLSTLYLVCF